MLTRVGKVPAESVELPDDEHIVLPQGPQADCRARPVVPDAGREVVVEVDRVAYPLRLPPPRQSSTLAAPANDPKALADLDRILEVRVDGGQVLSGGGPSGLAEQR